MRTVAHIASLVPLLMIAAVVLTLWSSGGDGQSVRAMSAGDGAPESVVDRQGHLRVPSNYRVTYEFLGTWAIAADNKIGSSQLHTVYASPGTIAAYHMKAHFPDGTVLVKEVYDTSTAPLTTGTVSHAQTLKGWFVMVKDCKHTYSGNPLWGDGWGWSWFDVGNPTKTTSTDYKKDCLPCHVPARDTDWIYTSGYPPLKTR
jgi:Cytochrome P460